MIYSNYFQVELDATALLHVGSDIAVDDIDVTHEPPGDRALHTFI